MKKILLVVCLFILPGCASIVSGNSQNINLMTSSGERVRAEVVTSAGIQKVELPTMMTVKRNSEDLVISIRQEENPCFNQSNQVVASNLNPWFLGNFITGGFFGSTTDGATGAIWSYDKNVIVQTTKNNECGK